MARYRGVGSRLDSYDGVGYGYIFIIASRYPLRFDRVSGFGLWDDLALDNYRSLIDPRESIRDFARTIAGGNDFTLQFARSGSTASLSSYADQRMDCALLSGFGFSFLPLWSYGFAPLWSANSGYLNNCGYSSAYALGAFGWPWNSYSGGPTFAGAPTNPNNPSSPRSGVPRFSRPGARRP